MNVVMEVKPESYTFPDPEPGMVFWWSEDPYMVVSLPPHVGGTRERETVYAINLSTGNVTDFTTKTRWQEPQAYGGFRLTGCATDIHIIAEEV